MARNDQIIRQHKTLQILERYRFGRLLEEIRDELIEELALTSLHERTVRRDLEALQAAGIDIRIQETQRGRVWKLGPQAKTTHKIAASATELISLSLGRDLMFPLVGTPFWQGIESFWNKLRDELPQPVWDHYEKYRRILHVQGATAKTYRQQRGILKTINRAILQHRVVEIDYQSVGKPSATRQVEPLAVVFYQSSLYILAAAHEVPPEKDRIRHLKLDRFHRAKILEQWFEPPDESVLQDHLGRSLGVFTGGKLQNFRIRISAFAAPWVIEDPWHPEQTIERRKDGSILLTVKAAHQLEVIPRVLALGGEAELLSPLSCRREIARSTRQMASTYDDVE